MEIREIEFTKLRHAYVTVKAFLESRSYETVKSLDTKVEGDLSLSGDDNLELLEEFVKKFELDHKDFDYSKHFHSEGELFDSSAVLLRLLSLSVWLPLKTIELLSLNEIQINKPVFHASERKVSDLTFRDLLTWYIEKEYKPSQTIKYQLNISK